MEVATREVSQSEPTGPDQPMPPTASDTQATIESLDLTPTQSSEEDSSLDSDDRLSDSPATDDAEDVRHRKTMLKRCRADMEDTKEQFSTMAADQWAPLKKRQLEHELDQLSAESHPEYLLLCTDLEQRYQARRQRLQDKWHLQQAAIASRFESDTNLAHQTHAEHVLRTRQWMLQRYQAAHIKLKDWVRDLGSPKEMVASNLPKAHHLVELAPLNDTEVYEDIMALRAHEGTQSREPLPPPRLIPSTLPQGLRRTPLGQASDNRV
ncbi:hypothetical protein H4R34_001793 [Dimargaris verticillata]|uniref:Sds3-like-domain-containing protein n=1 Tax=Dimargaris verticillata TaxID=2761393 RepID=A0A9W8EE59_9FUNG|nr:hypothetical protein H4R34_001793 [Dimargaris verticillata]